MRIRHGPEYTVSTGKATEADKIPTGGIYYKVFGEGTNLVDFAPMLESLDSDTRRLLGSIALRLTLVDRLRSLTTSLSDSQLEALPLYLLCTCIDSLANPSWLPFNDWIVTRKQKYQIAERDTNLQEWIGGSAKFASRDDLVGRILDLHSVYRAHHGISRKFGQFFLDLPDGVKSFMADSYMVLEGDQLFTDPAVHQSWLGQPVDERLSEIAGYLYQYRRNDFTHAGKAHRTTRFYDYTTPDEALTKKPGERHRIQILFFCEDDDYEKDVVLTVLVNEDEAFVLRTAILCHCRGLLGLENDVGFVSQHTERYHRLLILPNALREIQDNWRTYKYYSIDWMAYEDDNDRYYGAPEFQWQWLEAVLELDLDSYGLVTENLVRDVETCVSRLQALNEPIRRFNEDFPPLYVRRQRKDLQGVPEDQKAKQRAKVDLFKRLRETMEYRDVRWYLGQLIRIFSEMLSIVPDQGGPRAYIYSAPDYRGWL